MEFFLFILVNAAMFLRPAEIAPELAMVPVYLILILTCFVVSLPKLFAQWMSEPLIERPVTVCMLGLLAAVMLSHISHGNIGAARWWGFDYFKIVMYYLLLVGLVDTPARLRQFLISLLVLITMMTTLTLLNYHGYVDIPSLKILERVEIDQATGEDMTIFQLVGTGFFNDPNDLCLVLAMGILIGLYLFNDRRFGTLRILLLIPTVVLAYALILTQSRGGLLAILTGLLTLLAMRFGARKMIVLAVIGVPIVLSVLGGRISRLSTGEDTAQERIEIWRGAMQLFRQSPFFGNGANTIDDELGLVAHNSFVHAYAETGFFGGTLFLGAFFFGILMVMRIGRQGDEAVDPELRRMRAYLMAISIGFIASLFSITRNYSTPAYLAVGLAEVYQRIATVDATETRLRFNARLGACLLLLSVAFLIFIKIFVSIV